MLPTASVFPAFGDECSVTWGFEVEYSGILSTVLEGSCLEEHQVVPLSVLLVLGQY